jgi:hypothetical protein
MYGTGVRSPPPPPHILKMNSVPTSLLFRIHATNGNIELTCCVCNMLQEIKCMTETD